MLIIGDTFQSLSNDIDTLVENITEKEKLREKLDEAVQAKIVTRDAAQTSIAQLKVFIYTTGSWQRNLPLKC